MNHLLPRSGMCFEIFADADTVTKFCERKTMREAVAAI